MGGDDLESDHECLRTQYESDHSSATCSVKISNKRKSTGSGESSNFRATKKNKTTTGTLSDQTLLKQVHFLNSELKKYMSSSDEVKRLDKEIKHNHLVQSTKATLLQRVTDIVAPNKIRKWKHELSPCVVIICVSARRAVEVLKELAPIKARASKLFPKNGSVAEQIKDLAASPFGLAVGTPHRLEALCNGDVDGSKALNFHHTRLIVFDCHLSNKQYSVLTLPDTAPYCLKLLHEHVLPELGKRKDIQIALL